MTTLRPQGWQPPDAPWLAHDGHDRNPTDEWKRRLATALDRLRSDEPLDLPVRCDLADLVALIDWTMSNRPEDLPAMRACLEFRLMTLVASLSSQPTGSIAARHMITDQ